MNIRKGTAVGKTEMRYFDQVGIRVGDPDDHQLASVRMHEDMLAALAIARADASTASTAVPVTTPLTVAHLERIKASLEPLMPKPTDWVELTLPKYVAEIVGAPAVTIRRSLYDSLVNPLKKFVSYP